MIRCAVVSSSVREVGHDGEALEVQFHSKGCAAGKKQACDCAGGEVYRYPTVTPELHVNLMASESIGGHFSKHIRPHHPGVKL